MATAEAWQIINKVYANDKDQISVEVTDQHTLDKDAVSKLFRGLYSSTRVRSLSMQNVGLNDTHFQELVFIIGYNGFLKELSIVDEGLNLEAIETILWAINKKASISKLKLENPKTEILTTKVLFACLLHCLDLQNVGIHEAGFRGLKMLLIKNVTLRCVHVVDRNLTAVVIEDLLFAASVQSTLAQLELYDTTKAVITKLEDRRLRKVFAYPGILRHYQLYSVAWYGLRLERFVQRDSRR